MIIFLSEYKSIFYILYIYTICMSYFNSNVLNIIGKKINEIDSDVSSSSINLKDNTIDFSNVTATGLDHTILLNKGTHTHAEIDDYLDHSPEYVTIDTITPTIYKGDIMVENGSNVVRLGVGTTGQLLSADSNSSTGLTYKDDEYNIYITDAKQINGFTNINDSIISFDDNTRIFSISPTSSNYTYFRQSIKYTVSTTKTYTIPNVRNIYIFYFDENGDIQVGFEESNDLFLYNTIIAKVYWSFSSEKHLSLCDYRSGIQMDSATKIQLMETQGVIYISGLSMDNITIGDGTSEDDLTFGIQNGKFRFIDMEQSIENSETVILDPIINTYLFYHNSNSLWNRTEILSIDQLLKIGTNRLTYNTQDGSNWEQTELSEFEYVPYYVMIVNDVINDIVIVQGQTKYAEYADIEEC